MIEFSEVIAQDQLVSSSNPNKVRVRYPRGAQTVLRCNFDADPPTLTTDDPDADGAYQQFTVLTNGNLLNVPDKAERPATLILGAALVQVR